MNKIVMVPIPLSPEAAEVLRDDPTKLSLAGQMLTRMLHCPEGEPDPLLVIMEAMGRKAQAAGLTEADLDAELADWNAERRAQ